MQTPRKIILETKSLTKHYGGVQALNHADFKMYSDEHVAIVGDNGAGKSTFVRNITGVEQRTSGDVLFDGVSVNFNAPSEARAMGIETVYQNLALADHLDVPSNIFLGREEVYFKAGPLSWLNKKAMHKRAIELLDDTGIKIPDLTQPVAGMSGGQRQCVAISRAAGWGSKLIIMDEPTAGLDPNQVLEVRKTIKGLGKTILLSTHILQEVPEMADRIILINNGRLIFEGTPDDIKGESSLDTWFNKQTLAA